MSKKRLLTPDSSTLDVLTSDSLKKAKVEEEISAHHTKVEEEISAHHQVQLGEHKVNAFGFGTMPLGK